MTRIFSEALNQILTEPDAKVTALELADEAGVSRDMIYKVKNDKANLSHSKARALSRYMLREYGDKRLFRCFGTSNYEIARKNQGDVVTNGCVNDEAADASVALGHVVAEYREGDKKDMTDAIHDLEAVLDRLKVERDRL